MSGLIEPARFRTRAGTRRRRQQLVTLPPSHEDVVAAIRGWQVKRSRILLRAPGWDPTFLPLALGFPVTAADAA